MFEIGVIGEFEAAHSLSGDFGPATHLHGHTYKVEVRAEAREIDSSGTFLDMGQLQTELRAVLGPLHYRNLNEVAGLAAINTTAEAVARYIFTKLAPVVRTSGVEGLKVTVWESSSSFASYRESFD
ncbi:MAG TPA: 6-carboxytetrahydropterin synthase [Blastocatellia bacterium]|nr:6-carboxytetrahydropterin synthase [Blastocatellia bacterium]